MDHGRAGGPRGRPPWTMGAQAARADGRRPGRGAGAGWHRQSALRSRRHGWHKGPGPRRAGRRHERGGALARRHATQAAGMDVATAGHVFGEHGIRRRQHAGTKPTLSLILRRRQMPYKPAAPPAGSQTAAAAIEVGTPGRGCCPCRRRQAARRGQMPRPQANGTRLGPPPAAQTQRRTYRRD